MIMIMVMIMTTKIAIMVSCRIQKPLRGWFGTGGVWWIRTRSSGLNPKLSVA